MQTDRMTRVQIMDALAERDGPNCFLCKKAFLFNENGEPLTEAQERTIDHWYPQAHLFALGKTYEEVWNLSNLRLAHKGCNARKGDLIPIDDVTVPTRPSKTPPNRAVKRAGRPEVCLRCNSGRDLGPAETCETCGSGPMPHNFPHFAKVDSRECDHEYFWCWACSIGIHPRKAAIITVLDGEYLDE